MIYTDDEKNKGRQRGALDMGKTDDQILQLLNDSGPLTLAEIAEKLGKKPKAVFRSLRNLFEKGKIETDQKTRRYAIVRKEE